MRIEWQVVALSVLVMAGGACVPAGSKTSEDTVDDGSGGGGTDTEVTVEECYSGNPTREVAECMRTGEGLEETPPDSPQGDTIYDSRNESCASFRNDLRQRAEYNTWYSQAENCWDLCDGGEACADAAREWWGCLADFQNCILEAYGTSCNPTQSQAQRCSDEYTSCTQRNPMCAI